MVEVSIGQRAFDRFAAILDQQQLDEANRLAKTLALRLRGRRLWNVNSTATGGGVAEMLPPLLAYVRGIGCDARWMVIEGDPAFFQVTKRLHHALHGSSGDGSLLGEEARRAYDATTARNAPAVLEAIQPNDVVILHDPQTAGMAPLLIAHGALVIWRSHIGHDISDPEVANGWAFLRPYLEPVPAFVFSIEAYVPAYCDRAKTTIITPSVDAFSPKNQDLDEDTIRAILHQTGLVHAPGTGDPLFRRDDDSMAMVERRAEIIRAEGPPKWDTPLIVQVSRWDPLKDPIGVLEGFTDLVRAGHAGDAALMLVGPDVSAVIDDPEGGDVFRTVVDTWKALPTEIRARVHLVSLPMDDVEENAAMVNALQRHSAIIVQKSLKEGFGLTVTEAMWKGRPIVASAVGGICGQIDHGVHGLLIKDPKDRAAFSNALQRLLEDPAFAAELGRNARTRVEERFLGIDHLSKYARLIAQLDDAHGGGPRISAAR